MAMARRVVVYQRHPARTTQFRYGSWSSRGLPRKIELDVESISFSKGPNGEHA